MAANGADTRTAICFLIVELVLTVFSSFLSESDRSSKVTSNPRETKPAAKCTASSLFNLAEIITVWDKDWVTAWDKGRSFEGLACIAGTTADIYTLKKKRENPLGHEAWQIQEHPPLPMACRLNSKDVHVPSQFS
ncbi:hypothetical protein BCR33DRAFT_466496 [Rhizoclosmatium globosum]|uniref:Uncharacterized protein n=1 Tax=Rhizoclosmatium globosum TaxID=329046 RepID=A0A1Y2BR88_9FUNG|nr:hypothetical protein BCR33DRAFT_466496 [Rhizoclosmatium globosum]|eukprot:ORY37243.1 hypothetical protein BCR33DRAFT_466496 [Rhizoclosmatium globosum]